MCVSQKELEKDKEKGVNVGMRKLGGELNECFSLQRRTRRVGVWSSK